ncbi:hypothetical protein [uncultured Methylobacterium sp.]|uniref:hypothetical protein n=1 Tax=uncultured Methylobacterium sp. TaxID=157278 RepID=UPI002586F9D6|nr:hypothetical protein [uncultured Methylobacterium sp.]
MIRIAAAALALALTVGPSLAAPEPAPAPAPAAAPAVLILPVKYVVALRQYLGARPYDETAGLIVALEACASAQAQGGSSGRSVAQCPEVAAALQAREGVGSGSTGQSAPPEK